MLRIQRHGRIQELVAEELGIFKNLGLNYQFVGHRVPGSGTLHSGVSVPQDPDGLPSAYCDFLKGCIHADIAATSLWAVAVAANGGFGEPWDQAYGIMPAGIYVQPGTDIRRPEDLAGTEIVVGRHSGSHFSALFALQDILEPHETSLRFVAGRAGRLKALLSREAPAGSMYGLEAYILEQNGFVKILDTTFMVAYLIVGDPDKEAVQMYFEGMRNAQSIVDEKPQSYRHLLLSDLPQEIRLLADPHRCGIGERIEFGRCGVDTIKRARDWVTNSGILPEQWTGPHSRG